LAGTTVVTTSRFCHEGAFGSRLHC
jgi:hypothetical protein